MKEFNNIEREIQVVENIIRLLNECLAISLKNKQKEECKSILLDMKYCKNELKRLIGIRAAKAAREAAKEETEEKEPAEGNAAV